MMETSPRDAGRILLGANDNPVESNVPAPQGYCDVVDSARKAARSIPIPQLAGGVGPPGRPVAWRAVMSG